MVGKRGGVIPRNPTIPILKPEERSFDAILLRNDIAHPRVLNQLLPLEHAAQEQADNDQHDCDFDEGEAPAGE